jgi:tyrosyl-tRNA synthetase
MSVQVNIVKLLAEAQATVSMSQGRREVVMGAVRVNNVALTDFSQPVSLNMGDTIQIGKSRQILVTDELLEKSLWQS